MKTFNQFFDEQMNDSNFKKEYENLQPEFDVIRALINARKSVNITQQELARKTGISQADISKIENGTRNPTLNMLKRLADGLEMQLRLDFVPKNRNIS